MSQKTRIEKLEKISSPEQETKIFFIWGEDDLIEDNGEMITLAELEKRYPDSLLIGFVDEVENGNEGRTETT